jgi:hypothetical protein
MNDWSDDEPEVTIDSGIHSVATREAVLIGINGSKDRISVRGDCWTLALEKVSTTRPSGALSTCPRVLRQRWLTGGESRICFRRQDGKICKIAWQSAAIAVLQVSDPAGALLHYEIARVLTDLQGQ